MYGYFVKLLNMSLASSALILAVVAARFLLRKAPKRLVCLLWVIVALRLVVPVNFSSALSAFNYIGRYRSNDGQLSYFEYTGHTEKPEAEFHFIESTISGSDGPTVVMYTPSVYLPTLMQLWLAGAILLALYAAFSYLRVRLCTRESIRLRGNLYQCDAIPSPFILGLLCPRIYLPSDLSKEDVQSVVAHERSHIARGDHLWKPLGYTILCIHWFNPLVWLSYILLCRDIELACDERVIASMSPERKQSYCAALLRCSMPRRSITACPLAFGEVGVKQRVKGILNYRKPGFWVVALALVLCAVLSVVFLTNPEKQESTSLNPLMSFAEYLPEGYSLSAEDSLSVTILYGDEAIGSVQHSLLEIPENKAPANLTWVDLQEIWTVFGIDFDNEYLECMTGSSRYADWEGWFGIYDPETQKSTGANHYLYLLPGEGYDLAIREEDDRDEVFPQRFAEFLNWNSVNFVPQETVIRDFVEPEQVTIGQDINTDLTLLPISDPVLCVSDVISTGIGVAEAADGSFYEQYVYTVGKNAMIHVTDASTYDGKPQWILHPEDSRYPNIELRPGMNPIPVDCTYVLHSMVTDRKPLVIKPAPDTMTEFHLPDGYTFQPLSQDYMLIANGNAIVGELRMDAQVADLLENQNKDEIWRYLARGLQDGWYDEYIIEYWDNSIAVNYQITEESSGEQVQTGHWFFQKGGGAYELIFYYDMINREDADVIRKTMGVN